MTRILISINTSWNIVNFRSSLLKALRAKGYQIVSAAPTDSFTPRLAAMVDTHEPLPMDNDGTSPLQDAKLWWRYIQLLKKHRPDIMLTYTIKPNIFGSIAARCCGIPVIANVSGLGTAFLRRPWLSRIVKPLYRLAFVGAARVFFQNHADRQLFVAEGLVKEQKTTVIPGSGIDLEYFHPRHNMPRDANTTLRFVLIARLLYDKGIAEYVEAARRVKVKFPAVKFALVGPLGIANRSAVDEEMLNQWVQEGAIDYLGQTEDVRAILATQDCVVLPSYREGMSRVLLEAAAMGKPLIASDVPGCREVIEQGSNGYLCRPRDAENLAQQCMNMIGLSAQQQHIMGQKSREIAEKQFDEKQVIQAYLAAIEAVSAVRS